MLCKAGAQWNADLAVNYEINEQFSVYLNVLNFLDIDPEFDPSAAYSIFQYNPAWGQANMVGRYFRVGVNADTLRGWCKQADIDAGKRPGTTTGDAQKIKQLEAEVRELKRANEILLAASSFFARELDPRLPW